MKIGENEKREELKNWGAEKKRRQEIEGTGKNLEQEIRN